MSKPIMYLIPLLLIMGCEAQDNASVPKAQATIAEPSPTPSPSPSPTPTVVQATNCSLAGPGILAVNSVVSNNPRVDYPASNTIDNNIATFMTTNTLTLGQSITLAFELSVPANFLECLKFSNDFNNAYYYGDMEVFVSSDSTDGANGSWDYISTMTAATSYFFGGDGNISVMRSNVKWVGIKMTYNGTGASGGTPSFYFSELGFYGN